MSDEEQQGQLNIDGQVEQPAQEQGGEQLDQIKAQLKEEQRKREAAERQFSYFQRQNEQLQQQQQQAQNAMRGQEYATYSDEDQQQQYQQQRDEELRQEVALIKFRQLNPDWREYELDMQEFLSNEANARAVAAFDHTGRPNWGKSWDDTLMRVKNIRNDKAREAAGEAQAKANNQRDALNRAAVVTGDAGAEPEQTIDLNDPRNPDGSQMTSDQMIDAGLVEMDPNDPIRKIGTGKPRR